MKNATCLEGAHPTNAKRKINKTVWRYLNAGNLSPNCFWFCCVFFFILIFRYSYISQFPHTAKKSSIDVFRSSLQFLRTPIKILFIYLFFILFLFHIIFKESGNDLTHKSLKKHYLISFLDFILPSSASNHLSYSICCNLLFLKKLWSIFLAYVCA